MRGGAVCCDVHYFHVFFEDYGSIRQLGHYCLSQHIGDTILLLLLYVGLGINKFKIKGGGGRRALRSKKCAEKNVFGSTLKR